MTTTGCDECDRNGPYLPLEGWLHGLHRESHAAGRALTDLILEIARHWRVLAVVYGLVLLAAAIWGR